MLKKYKQEYKINNFQFITIDDTGNTLESDNILFHVPPNVRIQSIHPFFEIIPDLTVLKNECFEFSCVNLNKNEWHLIADITVRPKNNNENLIIIENLTKHYNNYQFAAQSRNESIIHSEILKLKNEYLLEKETFKNNFIANFSHQLRNPITASIVFSDLLISSNISNEQKDYIKIIQSANKDLKSRIEDILDTSKIESGKLILVDKVFDFKKILNEIIEGYNYLIIKKGLEFKVVLDPKLPEFLNGDSYRLKQIIGNLLNNAIKFTKQGFIELKIFLNYQRANKASIQIAIRDTGYGIATKYHDVIFSRYETLAQEKTNNNGIGLGLSLVKYLVSEMDGNINIESEINKGSKFTCNIPFKVAQYNTTLKTKLIRDLKKTHSNKKNILLVDDSELIQLAVLKILAKEGGFYLSIVSQGKNVISSIIDQNVDLILLSNTIEGFTAMDLTASIRNLSKKYKKTPIAILTTEVFKQDIKRFKHAGANLVITKPFDEKDFLAKIHKLVS